jgi:hypothetical protein
MTQVPLCKIVKSCARQYGSELHLDCNVHGVYDSVWIVGLYLCTEGCADDKQAMSIANSFNVSVYLYILKYFLYLIRALLYHYYTYKHSSREVGLLTIAIEPLQPITCQTSLRL